MDIKTSLEHILQSKDALSENFFRNLFNHHPEVREYFHKVGRKRQAGILTMQLSVIEVFHSTRSPATEKYLLILGGKHREWGVPQDAYPMFRSVLMETLQSFHGDDWSADLADQWRSAFDAAAEKMFEGYRQLFSL